MNENQKKSKKAVVIASDEGAKQSLNLFELTLEIARKGHLRLQQKTPRSDRNVPKLSAFVQELFKNLFCVVL